jgi:hypothetical protein
MTTEPRPALEAAAEPRPENDFIFITRRLRAAGSLIIVGVMVEGLSLVWNHPLSFLAFVGIGGLATAAGIAVYLFALVSPRQKS